MSAVRVRLLGGALSGHVLWVEATRAFVEVHVAGGGVPKTLRYLRDGDTASFVEELATAIPQEPSAAVTSTVAVPESS